MLLYQLRLAFGSLRKDWGLSLAMFVCLALGSGLWATVSAHYLREFPSDLPYSPELHQVELGHPRALALDHSTFSEERAWHARTWVTFPESEILAGSGVPIRQTASYRVQLLVAARREGREEIGPPAGLANARMVGADFFSMFDIPLGAGRPFTAREELERQAVVVLGRRFSERLFGRADSVGRALLVEGRPFRVVGVLAGDQPLRPAWDPVWTGHFQDTLYVPWSWARPLGAWPVRPLFQSPVATAAELWRSDAVFVSYWAELPATPDARARFQRYVSEHFTSRGQSAQVRDLAAWRRAFPIPKGDVFYFTILLGVGLVGAAFTTARLLLAKGLARRRELSIHRALGASRRALFVRQMLEGAMIALPASVAGLLNALAQHAFFNRVALENDIPIVLTWQGALLGVVPSFVVGLCAAVYPAWRGSRTTPTLRGENA